MRYRDFGKIIQDHAHKNGFSVVRAFVGHGINQLFHPPPDVPHYASMCFFLPNANVSTLTWHSIDNKAVGILRPGHCFTIEPMICEGDHREVVW